MPVRRQPTRTCVACRTERAKRELVRIVRTPEGRVVLDASGRLDGRGAYLCADATCWSLALKRGALQRALDASLSVELQAQLAAGAPIIVTTEGDSRGS
ncbi:MAG: RNase P modulator RnpM [Candidatus Limnocylindrales bacterium]